MDYPKSVPNIGLVDGKFVDENTGTGQVGSLIPAVWGTAVTDEILNVIKDAALAPKENENNQLSSAIKAIIKSNAVPSAPQAVTAGKISDIQSTAFGTYAAVTTDKPSSSGLFLRIKHPTAALAIDFAGHVGAGGTQYFFRRSNAAADNGIGLWDEVYHSGNFNPALKASLASPDFTGIPLAPTAAAGTNTRQMASTAFVWTAVNTYATTVTASLALKADVATSLRVGSVSRQRPVLSGTVPAGADGGSDGTGGAIEIREVNEVGAAQSNLLYAPGILFNWSNRFARYLKMSAVGDLFWGDKKLLHEGNITDMLATVAMQPNGRVLIPTKDGTPLYLQWYEGPIATAETVAYPAISHPVPFPNQCLFAGVFTKSTTDNTQSDQMFQMVTWDRLGVKVFPQWFGTGTQSLVKPLIVAIGN